MPLCFRLIARLDIQPPRLIKTVQLEGRRALGDPAAFAARYDEEGIDELLYVDVVASLYRRNGLAELVARASDSAFVPLTVAGGIRSVDDARALIRGGADKVAINSAAVARPALIGEIAQALGSQAVVIQIDAKRRNGSWEALCDGGRQPSGRDAVTWAVEAAERGAGEALVTSVDQEGTGLGFDLDLTRAVAEAVSVPVVASGGFALPSDAVQAAEAGASGVAIAGALHYRRVGLPAIKGALRGAGVPVR